MAKTDNELNRERKQRSIRTRFQTRSNPMHLDATPISQHAAIGPGNFHFSYNITLDNRRIAINRNCCKKII
jgi:hypothetical protein